jgi:prepilin-type N-terminal cleavage/methylation domain-containing protein
MSDDLLRLTLPKRSGFTVVELMVALVIMAICLVGVSEILQRSVAVERETSGRAEARARLSAMVDEVASTLEQAFICKDGKSVNCDVSKDGRHEMTCFVESSASQSAPFLKQKRYLWNDADNSGSGSVAVAVQQRPLSSAKASQNQEADADPETIWNDVPAVVLIDGISSFSVEFRPIGKEGEHWRRKWDGSAGFVARIRAKAAGGILERIVVPHVSASLSEESDK